MTAVAGLLANLFPARAGVILHPSENACSGFPIPRTRGGDPIESECEEVGTSYSPHARG